MHVCASKHKCVSLQVVNQRPYVQSCTELIADPSSVAHLKQNKKHPHQKKPQWREFLKCSAALCTSKRPTSATKTSLKSSANNGHFQKAERAKRWEKRERVGKDFVLPSPLSSLSWSSCMFPDSNYLHSVWSGVEDNVSATLSSSAYSSCECTDFTSVRET